MDHKELIKLNEDMAIDEDGNVVDVECAITEGVDNEARISASSCLLSYVDCKTKTTKLITLRPGQTFYYGDWNGRKCVRKSYTCR